MQRTLVLGVAAAVMLTVAPGPSRAAGVTRTAPYDFGVQCFERDASFSVPPIGDGTPSGCTQVADPAAYMGRLSTRTDRVDAGAALVRGGLTNGGIAHAAAGPDYASTGLNARTGVGGGRLIASAVVDGFTQGTLLCLFVGWSGYKPQAQSCGTQSPTVVVENVSPNTDYTIEVRLMAPPPGSVGVSLPCPPSGTATCKGGASWTSAHQDGITVREISYSFT